jgi:hypothetical protein
MTKVKIECFQKFDFSEIDETQSTFSPHTKRPKNQATGDRYSCILFDTVSMFNITGCFVWQGSTVHTYAKDDLASDEIRAGSFSDPKDLEYSEVSLGSILGSERYISVLFGLLCCETTSLAAIFGDVGNLIFRDHSISTSVLFNTIAPSSAIRTLLPFFNSGEY